MTTFQKWLIAILIVFGAVFLYILKTGIDFHTCVTGVNAKLAQERCADVIKTGGFGGIGRTQ